MERWWLTPHCYLRPSVPSLVLGFYPNVTTLLSGIMLSEISLSSVVCNVRAHYSAGWNFRQVSTPFCTSPPQPSGVTRVGVTPIFPLKTDDLFQSSPPSVNHPISHQKNDDLFLITITVRDSKWTDGACYKRDVRRSQHPRLSDLLVANGGVSEIASLQKARFWGFGGRLVWCEVFACVRGSSRFGAVHAIDGGL